MSLPHNIPSNSFYTTYDGHPPQHLRKLISATKSPIIYLAGDSSLDNKFWLPRATTAPPCEPYTNLLQPPICRRDISYWLNLDYPSFTSINCAVEATTLQSRRTHLLHQDVVIQEHISNRDVLIVSAGGNDVALAPTPMTVFSVLIAILSNGRFGVRHLRNLFRDQTQRYIQRLVERNQPRLILVCMIYFPHMDRKAASWASWPLLLLGYNFWPRRLQNIIKVLYREATCQVRVEGCNVVPVPLFEPLDGSDGRMYVERVEPSEEGGRVMSEYLKQLIEKHI